MVLGEQIKQKALELGFDLVGITDASPVSADQVARLVCWINAGRAGQMGWIRENLDKRVDPAKFLPARNPSSSSASIINRRSRIRQTEDGRQFRWSGCPFCSIRGLSSVHKKTVAQIGQIPRRCRRRGGEIQDMRRFVPAS